MNPRLYRQDRGPATDEPDDALDSSNNASSSRPSNWDLPVLAICRGMQLFNVVHGGTLEQHIEGHRQPGVSDAHSIDVEAGTRLAEAIGGGPHDVNSAAPPDRRPHRKPPPSLGPFR